MFNPITQDARPSLKVLDEVDCDRQTELIYLRSSGIMDEHDTSSTARSGLTCALDGITGQMTECILSVDTILTFVQDRGSVIEEDDTVVPVIYRIFSNGHEQVVIPAGRGSFCWSRVEERPITVDSQKIATAHIWFYCCDGCRTNSDLGSCNMSAQFRRPTEGLQVLSEMQPDAWKKFNRHLLTEASRSGGRI